MNGSGYLLYSAILGSGDWAVVVRGLQPELTWRIGLGMMGAVAYVGAVVLSAGELARVVENNSVSSAEIPGLVLLAYVVGSTLLVTASAFEKSESLSVDAVALFNAARFRAIDSTAAL